MLIYGSENGVPFDNVLSNDVLLNDVSFKYVPFDDLLKFGLISFEFYGFSDKTNGVQFTPLRAYHLTA